MGLLSRTAATGLYRLTPEGGVARELLAMQAGLDLLESRVRALEAAPFPEEMERGALRALCARCGVRAPAGLPLDTLRRGASALLGPRPRALAEIESFFTSLGASVALTEGPGRTVKMAGALGGLCESGRTARALLESLLAPGVAAETDLGLLTWDLFDGFGLRFDELDARGLAWDRLEAEGHLLGQGAA